MPPPLMPSLRARGVVAVLGPTNTGKTHYAIERMLAHGGGLIGLPLRLLAREVYARLVDRAGVNAVALVTGEEKIKPPQARYWVATVEAMPEDLQLPFVAIDEIQLAADFERGHVFTDRVLNMRGREETLLIGSETMRSVLTALIPGLHVLTRPRLSKLTYAGEMKVTRLPRRSAIVAFSADEVYAVAELMRRQRGGAAVVLGALSPRTRNAQVELYQSGEVDYLVATDAIGMGLNLDVDHVAFASTRKFDGRRHRWLYPAEFGQIAGRAGRYLRDGTFGTTGRCDPFDPELVEAVENHHFDAVQTLQWRNADLDFRSIESLLQSLEQPPRETGLEPAQPAEDYLVLDALSRHADIRKGVQGRAAVEKLWGLCQIPDYRRVSPQMHADLIETLFRQLTGFGRLKTDWFKARVAEVDRVDGDLDTLSTRIAHVRTLTFIAQRPDWLVDPAHWQGVTRQVEDKVSDALHERLTQRFVDRRTSVLMRRLRENAMLEAEISATGDVSVEGHVIGHLQGFQFVPDPQADGTEAKALRAAASKVLAQEFDNRSQRVINGVDDAFALAQDGALRWLGEVVARITAGDRVLEPQIRLLADEQLAGAAREGVEARLQTWLKAHITKLLGPLQALEAAETLTGIARGIAYQLSESLGVLDRSKVAEDVKTLEQTDRAALRALGVRFGAFHLTVPALLKPAPRALAAQLWALHHPDLDQTKLGEILHLAYSGRTSIPADVTLGPDLYRMAGFKLCGQRAVRVDILERLADLIRPAIQYRPGLTAGEPPAGAADGDGFVVTTSMTSLCGCAGEDFSEILRALGYSMTKRKGPAITKAIVPLAPVTEVVPVLQTEADSVSVSSDNADVAPQTGLSATDQPEQAAQPVENSAEETAPASVSSDTVGIETQPVAAEEQSAGSSDAVTEPEAAEELEIEIWRLQRHHHRPRPQHGQNRYKGRNKEQAASGDAGGDSQAQDKDGSAPRRERGSFKPRSQQGGGDQSEAGEGRSFRPKGPRPDHHKGRDGKPQGERGSSDRPGKGPRHTGRDRPLSNWQDQPRKQANKEPDPNSPFAKLLALKAQMQGGSSDTDKG